MGAKRKYAGTRWGKYLVVEDLPREKGDRKFSVRAVCDCGTESILKVYLGIVGVYDRGCDNCYRVSCNICGKKFFPRGTQGFCSPDCKKIGSRKAALRNYYKKVKKDPNYGKKRYQRFLTSGTPEEVAEKLRKKEEKRKERMADPEKRKLVRQRQIEYRMRKAVAMIAEATASINSSDGFSVKHCVVCNTPVIGRKLHAKHCSKKCSSIYSAKRRNERSKTERKKINCDECGNPFISFRKISCCSQECRRLKTNRLNRVLYNKKKG